MAGWLVPLLGSLVAAPTVLPEVPRVGYDVRLNPFIGSLHACLQYLKDPVGYDYLMGVSGACFRRFWNRDDGGNVDLMYLSPEPQRRVFEALGYEYETIRRERPAMLEAIIESIGLGRPVLGFGLIGPPEAGLICGYEQDGAVLRGWSYFQEPQPPGYYRLEGWFEKLSVGPPFGLIVLGQKQPQRPAEVAVLRAALEWAIDLAQRSRRPGRPEHVCGLAAYDAWADALQVDQDYPAADGATMATRAMVHADQAAMLYERHEAARFCRRMSEAVPTAAAPLLAAAALYDEVAGHTGQVWPWGHPHEPRVAQELADPARRRRLAAEVRAARAQEAAAVAHLERALALLGGQPGPVVSHLELQPSALVSYPRGFTPNPEDIPLPSALRAVMEFVGEDFGYTTSEGQPRWRNSQAYPYFMGLSGEAFEFMPPPTDAPGPQPEPPDLAERLADTLAGAGFASELRRQAAAAQLPQRWRDEVVASIAERGWPALLLDFPTPGVVAVVTAYEQRGAVIHGWSMAPGGDPGIRFEPAAREQWSDWEGQPSALLLLTALQPRQDPAAACRRALARGARCLRTESLGGWPAGSAAYESWAERLTAGALDGDDPETARRRAALLTPTIWDLAERRWYGSLFLTTAATALPAVATELEAAGACFVKIHDLMWAVNRLAGAQWPLEPMPALGSAETRRQIAELLLECRDQDQEAARHLEQALARLAR